MKKFSKILSSVLAASMIVSCFAVSSFAASKERTYTVVADKTEGLKAGDVVTIEVQADELLHAWNAGYTVYFDPDVFTLDTASGGRGKPKKYVDTEWDAEVKNADGIIGWYWGPTRVSSENLDAGTITVAWSGNVDAGEGITEGDNMTDYAIGKYFLIVKDDAPKGSTEITVDGATYGFGENSADPMTYVSTTVKVGEDAPVVPDEPEVTFDDVATGAFTFTTGPKYNGNEGFKLFFNKTENEETSQVYAELPKTEIFSAGTTVEADMEVSVGVEVKDVPSNVVLEFLRAEWLETLTK